MEQQAFMPTPPRRIIPLDAEKVSLELSGEILRDAFAALTAGAEPLGGIERYVNALSLKSRLFKDALADGKAANLSLETFMGLCVFMSSVRRRISPYLDNRGFEQLKAPVAALLRDLPDTGRTDERVAAFCASFSDDKQHRFVRDLAAELLHFTDPERYPLMCRWVWDAGTNTGSLREMWFADDIDHLIIPAPDSYETFLVLRQELSEFLSGSGVFRDMVFYVDLLCAQIYSHYICAQGGSYLRTDFSAPQDPMQYTRRLLGLDGVEPRTGKTRLKSIDGTAFVLSDDTNLLG